MSVVQNLVIIGAGGFGREVAAWALHSCEIGHEWAPKGFIDDDAHALDRFPGSMPLLGRVSDYQPEQNDLFVCAIGSVAVKERCVQAVLARGGRFSRLTHRTALIGPRARIGAGVILCPHAVVSCDVTIGDYVGVNLFASVQHDATVGDFAHVQAYVDIGGGASVGRRAFLDSHCSILPRAIVPDGARVAGHKVVSASPH